MFHVCFELVSYSYLISLKSFDNVLIFLKRNYLCNI